MAAQGGPGGQPTPPLAPFTKTPTSGKDVARHIVACLNAAAPVQIEVPWWPGLSHDKVQLEIISAIESMVFPVVGFDAASSEFVQEWCCNPPPFQAGGLSAKATIFTFATEAAWRLLVSPLPPGQCALFHFFIKERSGPSGRNMPLSEWLTRLAGVVEVVQHQFPSGEKVSLQWAPNGDQIEASTLLEAAESSDTEYKMCLDYNQLHETVKKNLMPLLNARGNPSLTIGVDDATRSCVGVPFKTETDPFLFLQQELIAYLQDVFPPVPTGALSLHVRPVVRCELPLEEMEIIRPLDDQAEQVTDTIFNKVERRADIVDVPGDGVALLVRAADRGLWHDKSVRKKLKEPPTPLLDHLRCGLEDARRWHREHARDRALVQVKFSLPVDARYGCYVHTSPSAARSYDLDEHYRPRPLSMEAIWLRVRPTPPALLDALRDGAAVRLNVPSAGVPAPALADVLFDDVAGGRVVTLKPRSSPHWVCVSIPPAAESGNVAAVNNAALNTTTAIEAALDAIAATGPIKPGLVRVALFCHDPKAVQMFAGWLHSRREIFAVYAHAVLARLFAPAATGGLPPQRPLPPPSPDEAKLLAMTAILREPAKLAALDDDAVCTWLQGRLLGTTRATVLSDLYGYRIPVERSQLTHVQQAVAAPMPTGCRVCVLAKAYRGSGATSLLFAVGSRFIGTHLVVALHPSVPPEQHPSRDQLASLWRLLYRRAASAGRPLLVLCDDDGPDGLEAAWPDEVVVRPPSGGATLVIVRTLPQLSSRARTHALVVDPLLSRAEAAALRQLFCTYFPHASASFAELAELVQAGRGSPYNAHLVNFALTAVRGEFKPVNEMIHQMMDDVDDRGKRILRALAFVAYFGEDAMYRGLPIEFLPHADDTKFWSAVAAVVHHDVAHARIWHVVMAGLILDLQFLPAPQPFGTLTSLPKLMYGFKALLEVFEIYSPYRGLPWLKAILRTRQGKLTHFMQLLVIGGRYTSVRTTKFIMAIEEIWDRAKTILKADEKYQGRHDVAFEAHLSVLLSKACRKVSASMHGTVGHLQATMLRMAEHARKLVQDHPVDLKNDAVVVDNNYAKSLAVAGRYSDAEKAYCDLYERERRCESPTTHKTAVSALKCLKRWGSRAPANIVQRCMDDAEYLSSTLEPPQQRSLAAAARECAAATLRAPPPWAAKEPGDRIPTEGTSAAEAGPDNGAGGALEYAHLASNRAINGQSTDASLFSAPWHAHGLHECAQMINIA